MPHRGTLKDDLSHLEQVAYRVNELDEGSASVGTFIYDADMYRLRGTYWALSKVFEYPDDLFNWLRGQGFRYHCVMHKGWIGRTPC